MIFRQQLFRISNTVSVQSKFFAIAHDDFAEAQLLHVSAVKDRLDGGSEETMGYASKYVSELADIVDINMGCPAPKVVKNGDGSKLLLNPELIGDIVQEVVKTVEKPVTVKMRKGWDKNNINAVEVAKIIEQAGASAITIHGRTREEYYSGRADLDIIKQVKESVNIPVIGNGDIKSIEDANKMFEYCNVDGIMIGRATIGNPWIINDIIKGEKREISNEEKLKVLKQHIELAVAEKGEYIAVREIINKITKKINEIIDDKKKTEDDKWYELYKIDIEEFDKPDDYIEYKLKYKKKFINKVIQYAENKKVIEMGCGTGLMAGYLQKLGLDVIALDLSQAVLNYACEIAKQSNIISPCKYEQGDILNLKYKPNTFDVSYSNGVLEHFTDEEIIEILKQQMNISKYVIFGIPSTYFNMNEKMLGNERGLTLKEWKSLINKAGGKLVEQTSFHYYKFYRRIFEVKKWLKPKAFWLFVIEKK